MQIAIMLMFLSFFFGTAVFGPTCVALWLVWSRFLLPVRLLGFAISLFLFGTLLAPLSLGKIDFEASLALYFTSFVFALAIWLIETRSIRITCLVLTIGMLVYPLIMILMARRIEDYGLMGVCMLTVSAITYSLPLCGYHLIRLTGDVSDQELEQGTQRSVDQWIEAIDAVGGPQMTRSEIVGYLRTQGIPFVWQRIVTDAYETAIGRIVVCKSSLGNPQTTVRTESAPWYDRWRKTVQPQWTSRQMMGLLTAVALLMAFIRTLNVFELSGDSLIRMLPIAAGSAVIAIAVLRAVLRVKPRWTGHLIYGLVSVAVAWIVYRTIDNVNIILCTVGALGMLVYTLLMVLAMTVIRNQGYRLIAIGPGTPLRP